VVVVHTAPQKALTDVFRDRVMRELGDGLQASLGGLARVKVVGQHDRLPEVLDRGLQRALDGWTHLDGVKTHFILMDFADDRYEIQARQYDGVTGLAGPVVRRQSTDDRELVARTAALMVEHDLGLLGAVAAPADVGGGVKLRLQGGGLNVPLERWVQPGEVFAVVRPVPGQPTRTLPSAVLRVEKAPQGGQCECRYFSRWVYPLRAGDVCVKLGTTSAPLRVRLVQGRPGETAFTPLEEVLNLEARHLGFDGEDASRLTGGVNPGADTYDTSREKQKGVFAHVAFLSVYSEGARRATVPVAMVEDHLETVAVEPKATDADPLRFRRDGYLLAVSDAYLKQAQLFKEVNDLTDRPGGRPEAIKKGRDGLQRGQAALARLEAERGELLDEARKAGARLDLAAADQRVKKMRDAEAELDQHLGRLEAIEKKVNDPKRRELLALRESGLAREKDGDYEGAIAAFEKVLAGGLEDEDGSLRQRVAKLKASWEPKTEEHRQARKFIYHTWPTLPTAQIKGFLPQARQAFEACKKEKDLFGPQKLLDATLAHGVRLEKELAALKPHLYDEDEKPAKFIQEVNAELGKLATDIDAYLRAAAP
jgi:hypothetical protein